MPEVEWGISALIVIGLGAAIVAALRLRRLGP